MLKPETDIPNKHLEFIAHEDNNYNFSINLFLKENIIVIESTDLENDPYSKNKFINELFLIDWKKLNKDFNSFNNVDEIFFLFNNIKNTDFFIIKDNNETKLKIILEDKCNKYPVMITLNKDKNKENNIINNNIIEENIILKNDKKNLEEKIEMLEDEINKIKYSLPFNLFDDTLYVLEKVFNNLDSFEIISKREYLGVINSGIKKIFKKNIKSCSLAYIFSKGNDQNLYQFSEKCQKLENLLIIIKTMNNKTFGGFFHKINPPFFYEAGEGDYFGMYNNHINIFYSKNYNNNNSFIFSLDKKKIYYNDLFYKDSYEEPNFSIYYDENNKCFMGEEYKNEFVIPRNNYFNNTSTTFNEKYVSQKINLTEQYIQPDIQKEIQPKLQTKIQPVIKREIQPIVETKIQPVIKREIQPIVKTKPQPIIHKEVYPIEPLKPVLCKEEIHITTNINKDKINKTYEYDDSRQTVDNRSNIIPNPVMQNIFEKKNNFILNERKEFIISNLEIFDVEF